MVEALVSLFQVQLLARHVTRAIEPGLAAQTHRVDDEGVSVPTANGVAHERIFQLFLRRVSSSIGPDLPYGVIPLVEDEHAAGRLYDFVSANTDRAVIDDQHRWTVRNAVLRRI